VKLTLARWTLFPTWRSALRPRVAWIAMLLSAVLAGWAMQASIDRLTDAAEARSRLAPTAATPSPHGQMLGGSALDVAQLQAQLDAEVQTAARHSQWIVWGALAWMMGVGMVSVLSLQRRDRPQPVARAAAAAHTQSAPGSAGLLNGAESARAWQSVRQEIEALRALMDAPLPEAAETRVLGQAVAAPEARLAGVAAPSAPVVGRIEPSGAARPPFEMRDPVVQLELRLAA
jgi:hypothetical protein